MGTTEVKTKFSTEQGKVLSLDNLGYIFGPAEQQIKESWPENGNKIISIQISKEVNSCDRYCCQQRYHLFTREYKIAANRVTSNVKSEISYLNRILHL